MIAAFVGGLAIGLLAHAWIVSRKLAELRETVYWLSPPGTEWPG